MRKRDQHLKLRGDNYHFVLRVPTDVAPVVGKKLIQESLKTSNLTEARRKRDQLEAHHKARWNIIRDALKTRHMSPELASLAATIRNILADLPDDEATLRITGKIAEQIEDQLTVKAAAEFQGKATGELKSMEDAVTEFLARATLKDSTKRLYRSALNVVCDRFPYISDIDRKTARIFLQAYAETHTPKAIKNLIAAASSLYAFHGFDPSVWKEHKLYPGKENTDRGIWTDGEVHRLIEAARKVDPRMADALTIAAYTGMRRQEIAQFRYDEAKNQIVVEAAFSKTKDSIRRIPCHPEAREAVQRFIRDRLSVHMLSSRLPQVIEAANVEKEIKIDGKPHKRDLHAFRHTFASKLAEAGADEASIARLLGHAPRGVTRMYSNKVDPDSLRPALELLKYPSVSE
ncbi:site-specific recombinase XerD [Microvirga subterranea]|uniref:Site-specific recombinase XerD n=2 Tax=Microvirga subterranea TaxID=186651 RepID=A0A370HQR9_9HYPH|nr:site-specific recombinase XerD [Microvirga subterranea]